MRRILLLVLALGVGGMAVAQPVPRGQMPSQPQPKKEKPTKPGDAQKLELAQEYYRRGDFEKAVDIYNDLQSNEDLTAQIHEPYVKALQQLQRTDQLEKYLRKVYKRNPQQVGYAFDLATFYTTQKKEKDASRLKEEVVSRYSGQVFATKAASTEALNRGLTDWAEAIILEARKKQKDAFAYSMEMAEVYKRTNRIPQMLLEMVAYLERDPTALPMVTGAMQANLTKPEDFAALEKMLLEKSQKDPDNLSYAEVLQWIALQRKDFYSAFIQAKAIDRRTQSQGARLLDVAHLARENGDHENAIIIYEYVAQTYASQPVYFTAQRLLINTKETVLRKAWPTDTAAMHGLVRDYAQLISRTQSAQNSLDNVRSQAMIYGEYLNRPDSAIILLQRVISTGFFNPPLVNRSKLDLGDMYLLVNEPWESTLLYSQVEKDQKEAPLGHEAKLRNARLSYFRGEFDLAREHLDVLKLATSREIANDALNLSLRIQDALAFDTTGAALREFSQVELMLFKHQDAQALVALDAIAAKYPQHTLKDEVLWLKATTYRRTQRYSQAIEELNKLVKEGNSGIYADEALYTLGQIYDYDLHDKAKAMDQYSQLMEKFPGSIFTAESRKRYRTLRGDAVN